MSKQMDNDDKIYFTRSNCQAWLRHSKKVVYQYRSHLTRERNKYDLLAEAGLSSGLVACTRKLHDMFTRPACYTTAASLPGASF